MKNTPIADRLRVIRALRALVAPTLALLIIVSAPSHPAPFEPLCFDAYDVPACNSEFDLPTYL